MAKYTITVRDCRPKPLNLIKIRHTIEKTSATTFLRITDDTTLYGSSSGYMIESVNGKLIPDEIAVTHHGEVVGFLVKDAATLDDFELNII